MYLPEGFENTPLNLRKKEQKYFFVEKFVKSSGATVAFVC